MSIISPLAKYTLISPNKSARTKKIDKITPHHMAAVLSVESCGQIFQNAARQASSNYGIGNDGRIACYVPEEYQAWTSSNWENDQRAVTIEVSNSSTGGDWPVSDAAWKSLVSLCVDICRRNGIKSLKWDGSPNGSLTAHYMFSSTACPGPYLKHWMASLADEVNAELSRGNGTWKKDNKGWWYQYGNGGYPKNSWLQLDTWYYFDGNGYAVTGWKKIGGKWYYFDSGCHMLTGWVKTDGKWSYLATDGHMVTGWQKVNGNWFYMNASGYMLENEWVKYGDKWCYLKSGGYMARSECLYLGGRWWAFDSNGYNFDPKTASDGSLIL